MRRPENAYHFLQLQPISCNCLLLSSRNFSSLLGVFCLPLGRTNCSVLNKILRFNSLSGQWPLTAFREAGNGTGRCIFRLRSQGFIVPCSAIKLLPFLKYAKKRWHSFASRDNRHCKGCFFFLQWVCALTSMKQERETEYPTTLKTQLLKKTQQRRKGPNMEFSQRNLWLWPATVTRRYFYWSRLVLLPIKGPKHSNEPREDVAQS